MISTLILCVLTILAWHQQGLTRLDRMALHGYTVRDGSRTYRIASLLTELGSPVVVVLVAIAVAALVWFRDRSVITALACVAAPGVAGVVETVAKMIVSRPRPETSILTGESGNGFPSGHATGFMALALIVTLVWFTGTRFTGTRFAGAPSTNQVAAPLRRRRIAVMSALLLGAIIAVTRVVVGAHYPIDAIAGFFLGASIADAIWFAVPYIQKRFSL